MICGGHAQAASPSWLLFVCQHNDARLPMAEALCRALTAGRLQVASAGLAPTSIHPYAVAVLEERGLDPSAQSAKALHTLALPGALQMILLLDRDREPLPAFPPGTRWCSWHVPDPVRLSPLSARVAGFRRTACDLQQRIRLLAMILGRGLPIGP